MGGVRGYCDRRHDYISADKQEDPIVQTEDPRPRSMDETSKADPMLPHANPSRRRAASISSTLHGSIDKRANASLAMDRQGRPTDKLVKDPAPHTFRSNTTQNPIDIAPDGRVPGVFSAHYQNKNHVKFKAVYTPKGDGHEFEFSFKKPGQRQPDVFRVRVDITNDPKNEVRIAKIDIKQLMKMSPFHAGAGNLILGYISSHLEREVCEIRLVNPIGKSKSFGDKISATERTIPPGNLTKLMISQAETRNWTVEPNEIDKRLLQGIENELDAILKDLQSTRAEKQNLTDPAVPEETPKAIEDTDKFLTTTFKDMFQKTDERGQARLNLIERQYRGEINLYKREYAGKKITNDILINRLQLIRDRIVLTRRDFDSPQKEFRIY